MTPDEGSAAAVPAVVDHDDRDVDEDRDDPDVVESILSRELLRLSIRQRTEVQEEIHGVRCMAPKETPELLAQSLAALEREIDSAIPSGRKIAYLRARLLPETYVDTDDFRLRFLRFELFDVPRAAARMVRFLELALEMYGEHALRRPIRLSDFSPWELRYFRKGNYQFLPYRDRSGILGRRVLVIFPDGEWEDYPLYLKIKIIMYLTWTAGEDVETQREGLVFVTWFDDTANVSQKPAVGVKEHEVILVRPVAIHICTPDTPFYRFRRSIMMMRIGQRNRTRLVVHLGNSVERRYKLASYGIPPDQLPITFTGRIKTIYFRQWLRARKSIELSSATVVPPTSPSSCSRAATDDDDASSSSRVESPFLSDVIFRKGVSLASHPANAWMRAIILAKVRGELLESDRPERKSLRRFVLEVVRELWDASRARETARTGRACRFLVWHEEGGWWTELLTEGEIHARVSTVAKGIRAAATRSLRASASTPPQSLPSATTTKKKKKKSVRSETGTTLPAAQRQQQRQLPSRGDSTTIAPGGGATLSLFPKSSVQHLHGGTDIFRYLDRSDRSADIFLRDIKRRRTLLMMTTTHGDDDDDIDKSADAASSLETECFGMKFNTTTGGCF